MREIVNSAVDRQTDTDRPRPIYELRRLIRRDLSALAVTVSAHHMHLLHRQSSACVSDAVNRLTPSLLLLLLFYPLIIVFYDVVWSSDPSCTATVQSFACFGSSLHFLSKMDFTYASYTDRLFHGLVGPLGPMASHVLKIRLRSWCGRTWHVIPLRY